MAIITTMTDTLQTALVPRHEALINFSKYLAKHHFTSSSVPFPGTPHPSDITAIELRNADPWEFMTEQDIADLKDLYADLTAISQRAHDRGVKLIIDAEYR